MYKQLKKFKTKEFINWTILKTKQTQPNRQNKEDFRKTRLKSVS